MGGMLMSEVTIIVGSPGSGKSWITKQLKNKFEVVEHDLYLDKSKYISALAAAAKDGKKVLGESPFGISEIMERLAHERIACNPVFVIEDESTLKSRYWTREGKEIPKGHLTRQKTYKQRAKDLGSFYGTSSEVLAHLKGI